MKNVIKLGFVFSLCFSQNGHTQIVIPHGIPCVDVTPANVGTLDTLTVATECVQADGMTVSFESDRDYTLKAGEYIQFDDNTVIETVGTHSFHAYIENEGMDLGWYYPYSTPGSVGRYEKLELGVQFQDSTNQKIENFVQKITGDSLNPYNPEDIDLHAQFWYLAGDEWWGPKRINGFYYEEFSRGFDTWDTVASEHNFRIRFAPEIIGTWKCEITANIRDVGEIKAYDFTFDCVASSNKGFVKVGDNHKYLKVGDEPFYPVGQNLTGPKKNGKHPLEPIRVTNFFDTMKELKEEGANYFRYIVCPWQTEIEFEQIGDYSNRMTNAWEFDNILDTAKTLDLKIHYDMAIHFSFERPNGYYNFHWDWSAGGDTLNRPITPDGEMGCFRASDLGYCYRKDLDILDPIIFLVDSLAKKHYKNRLRYMVARWGYSTEIGVMELLSEANKFGAGTLFTEGPDGECIKGGTAQAPYKDHDTIPLLIYHWQNEMLQYIKEELGHTQHPLSVSYAGDPDLEHGDSIYFSPYVDIASFNNYGLSVDKVALGYNYLYNKYLDPTSPSFINKPFMHSEYGGNEHTHVCDNNAGYIKRSVLSPFVGIAASAISWDSHYNEQDSWKHLKPIKDIMEGIPLDDEDWFPLRPKVQPDLSVELFALRKESFADETKMIGAISNRTYNYWTQGDSLPCLDPDLEPLLEYMFPVDYTFSDLDTDSLKFKYMGINQDYRVEWYNALTGVFVAPTFPSSNIFGNLVLEFPDTLTGDEKSPILFFRLYPVGDTFLEPIEGGKEQMSVPEGFKRQEDISDIQLTDWSTLNKLDESLLFKVNVSPNPTNDFIRVNISGNNMNAIIWTLVNLNGDVLLNKQADKPNFLINLSVYSSGIYFLNLESNTQQEVIKILKQ